MRYWADFKRGRNDYSSHFTATAKHKRNTMSRTYKAVQATQPGKLEVVERAMIEPAFGQVRIRVEACGVCHSDALTVEGGFPGLTFPRVPGHEVIGKIEAIGPGVQGWKEGQRVGVGSWVAIAGIAKTVAVATSSIARTNPFRVCIATAVMPK